MFKTLINKLIYLLIVVISFFFAAFSSAPKAQADTTSGLVRNWKFDEGSGLSAGDSASGNTATLNNGPAWTSGELGNALSFDGVNDYLSTTNGPDFGTGSFTYSLWVNVSQNVGNYDMPWQKGGACALCPGYDMELGANGWAANVSDGASSAGVSLGSEILNAWTLLTVVVDRPTNMLRAYRNNSLVDSVTISGFGSLSSSQAATIGGQSPYFFQGSIDDVRIYSRALSSSDVTELYNSGGSPTPPPTPNPNPTPPPPSTPGTGNNYYVSQVSGSDSNPCTANNISVAKRTINEGLKCLNGGDILNIRSGTYAEQINRNDVKSGLSWTSPTIIQAYQAEQVIVTGGLWFQSPGPGKTVEYIIVRGQSGDKNLIFDGSNGVALGGARNGGLVRHIRLDNITVRNNFTHNCVDLGGGDGFDNPISAHYLELRNSRIYNCGSQSTGNQEHAVYGTTDHIIVDNNDIYDSTAWGIHFHFSNPDSIQVDDNIISNNRIHNVCTNSVTCAAIAIGQGHRNKVFGNVIWNILGKTGDGGLGLTADFETYDTLFYNNTIYNTTWWGIDTTNSTRTVVKNNIFSNVNTAAFGPAMNLAGSGDINSNNLCTSASANCPQGNPNFLSVTTPDFNLGPGSSAIDAGTVNIAAGTTLTNYSGTAPDIGAYESSGGSPQNPPTISASPSSLPVGGGVVTVNVQNSPTVGCEWVGLYVVGNANYIDWQYMSGNKNSCIPKTMAQLIWTLTSTGSYQFKLHPSSDETGETPLVTSNTVTVASISPDTTAPTASITAPSASTVSGTITYSAAASDPTISGQVNSGLSLLSLFIDGNLYATSTTGSISRSLDTTTLTNANHQLTATARDNAGNTFTTSAITINVNNAPAQKFPRTITLSSLEGLSAIPANQSITISIMSGSTVLRTQTLTPNASKQYTVTFQASDPQIVDVRVSVNKYLSRKLTSLDTTLNSATVITVPQLLAGDLNNDNSINTLDYSIMNTNWNQTSTLADINGDSFVNSLDYAILKNNFNKVGE